jgi:tellurite resistance protein TerC
MLESLLLADLLGQPAWAWLLFIAIVLALLAFDLGVLHRRQREIGAAESLWLSAAYVAVALAFAAWVWGSLGAEAGMAFLTGFFLEKALALDNVFVIALIFAAFAIPRALQHRVLVWGILGVLVLRAIMIGLGAAAVSQAAWVLYLFGAFLIATGIKMLLVSGHAAPAVAADNAVVRLLRRRLAVTDQLHGERFWVRLADAGGRMRWHATPLLLALVAIELADLVFAVDSVPAIFAVTTDPYIVYTSNIFAILGLRALYFALAAMVERFAYLKVALSLVLVFIGGKIFWTQLVAKPDPAITLGVTAALIAGGVVVSLVRTRPAAHGARAAGAAAAPAAAGRPGDA